MHFNIGLVRIHRGPKNFEGVPILLSSHFYESLIHCMGSVVVGFIARHDAGSQDTESGGHLSIRKLITLQLR